MKMFGFANFEKKTLCKNKTAIHTRQQTVNESGSVIAAAL